MIMIRYLFSDFARAIRSKGAKAYFIGTAALILIANIAVICFRIIYGSNEGTFAYNVFEYASWCFLIPYYSCILIGMIAFGPQYVRPRKRGMTLGCGDVKHRFSPALFYMEKLVLAILCAAVFLVAAFVMLYVITLLFHINEGMIGWPIVKNFLNKACLSLPLWFAGISFAIMFLFIFEKKWKAVLGFAVVTVVIPQIIRIFSLDNFKLEFFRTIRRYTITQSFGLVPYPSYPDRSVPLIVTLGFVYGILAVVIGMIVYGKKAVEE